MNRSRKQASVNVGAEGTDGVDVSSAAAVPEVDALGLFLLHGPEVALFALTMLYKKNTKFRIQRYKL